MGWNAGGFGSMTFPSEAALAAWRTDTTSHAAWDDWMNELESTGYLTDDATVADRLKQIAKGDQPKQYSTQRIAIAGTSVTLLYDDGEDGFRDGAGDLAATLRAADRHGAKGQFYFLGTAGAEYDFVYSLALDGKSSKLVELKKAEIAKVYEGAPYATFKTELMAVLEANHPQLKKMMTGMREGAPAAAAGARLHARVVAALAKHADAKLAAAAKRYPYVVPDGTASVFAKQLFAKDARAKLVAGGNEETRAVALWVLGELEPEVAVPIAFDALDDAKTAARVRTSALWVCGDARGDQAIAALDRVVASFLAKPPEVYAMGSAQRALLAIQHPSVPARFRALLKAFAKQRKPSTISPAGYVIAAMQKREMTDLALPLAEYATSKADPGGRNAAANVVLAWKDREALAQLAKGIDDEYGIGVAAASALLAVDRDAAFAKADPIAHAAKADKKRDRVLHHLLQAVIAEARTGKALEPRWIELGLALLGQATRPEPYLAYNALDLLRYAKRDARVVPRIEALLASGTMEPIQVIETLKAMKSTKWKAIAKARLAKSKNPNERSSLEMML